MNGTERRRLSREREAEGLGCITIIVNIERVGDLLQEARLVDPIGETSKADIADGIVEAARPGRCRARR